MTAPTQPAEQDSAADTAEPEHTGGMIALVPANPDELTVDGGDPAEQMHLTLAYLGDDVTAWPPESRDTLLSEMEELVAGSGEDSLRDSRGPIEARVMGHAQFNPDGGPDGDREPCAVYLVGDAPRISDLQRIIRGIVENKEGVPEQHDPMIPHITAGYGITPDQLSFVGPMTFDRLRVALADQVHDFPLGESQEETVTDTLAAAATTVVPDTIEATGPAVDGEIPINLPVVVIEGIPTSDGRLLQPGSLTPRALPLSLLAQPESAHGGDEPGPAGIVGRIDTLVRKPGPEVTSKRTGEPFPEGSFVWVGTGTLWSDATVGGYNIAELFQRGFLRGISVDLAGMDYEVLSEDNPRDAESPNQTVVAYKAELAAATLCAIPAFSDAYGELATDTTAMEPVALEDFPEGLVASAMPAWRSPEVGDRTALVASAAVEVPADAVAQLTKVIDDGTGVQRDAGELAQAIVDHIAAGWPTAEVGDDEPDEPVKPDMMAEQPVEEMPVDEMGAPDAPQDCLLGEAGPHPATQSLLFDGGAQFLATCDEHAEQAAADIAAQGFDVEDTVPIAPSDAPALEEVPA